MPIASCLRFPTTAAPRARLFCFPYAGGNPRIYSRWRNALPQDVEVHAIELPGRGSRSGVPHATDIASLIADLAPELERIVDGLPFFFFGHSMGALLAFLCARALRSKKCRLPAHMFVSARRPPHHPNVDSACATMGDLELMKDLRKRGGTAPEVLAEPELMARFLPIIRADFSLLNSYTHSIEPPLECPITAFGGTMDERARSKDLLEWNIHTSSSFSLHMIEGGHFFVDTCWDEVVGFVASTIAASLLSHRNSNADTTQAQVALSRTRERAPGDGAATPSRLPKNQFVSAIHRK